MANYARIESYGLALEAERRAREGQPFSLISRTLGVPLSTLNYWALKGCFRRCDLDEEAAIERTKVLIERIMKARVREKAEKEELAAQLRAVAAQLKIEVDETKMLEPACMPKEPAS
ncbi:MAG TPA: hypothetical protein VG942_16815 [Hyphomonadaceae bacterium]|nr:hypothetical protein [Hyphomonadaceae bacterium]